MPFIPSTALLAPSVTRNESARVEMSGAPASVASAVNPAIGMVQAFTWNTNLAVFPARSGVTSGVYVGQAGVYRVTGFVAWASNATGYRYTSVRIGGLGVDDIADLRAPANGSQSIITISDDIFIPAGSYVELYCMQTSGGPLNVVAGHLTLTQVTSPSAPAVSTIVPYATTLPTTPFDGQEAILVDSVTVPTYQWRFRYNAISSNTDKWEFTGGPDALAEVTALEATTTATYVALTTPGPSIVIPRAGVYDVECGCYLIEDGSATAWMSYDIGGTGAADADALNSGAGAAAGSNVSRIRRKTLTAVTLTAKYRTTTAGQQIRAGNRFISVTPVRVS